jgi:Fur family ferric uptake transcriptional regulator
MSRRKEQGDAANKDALYAKLEAYMSKEGLRNTNQRRVIAEAFFEGPAHVTIEELLAKVREVDSRIGYATVYRTLKLFTDCGIAAERNFGDGPSRYELSDKSTNDHHDHLICLECGKIIEFHNERIEELQEQITEKLDFHVESHKHEIYGYCADCRRRSR